VNSCVVRIILQQIHLKTDLGFGWGEQWELESFKSKIFIKDCSSSGQKNLSGQGSKASLHLDQNTIMASRHLDQITNMASRHLDQITIILDFDFLFLSLECIHKVLDEEQAVYLEKPLIMGNNIRARFVLIDHKCWIVVGMGTKLTEMVTGFVPNSDSKLVKAYKGFLDPF